MEQQMEPLFYDASSFLNRELACCSLDLSVQDQN